MLFYGRVLLRTVRVTRIFMTKKELIRKKRKKRGSPVHLIRCASTCCARNVELKMCKGRSIWCTYALCTKCARYVSVVGTAICTSCVQKFLSFCIFRENDQVTMSLKMISKWGFDGSSGHSNYKLNNSAENSHDGSIFLTCLVPLCLTKVRILVIFFMHVIFLYTI